MVTMPSAETPAGRGDLQLSVRYGYASVDRNSQLQKPPWNVRYSSVTFVLMNN